MTREWFSGRTATRLSLAATFSPTFAHTTATSSSPEQAAMQQTQHSTATPGK